MEIRGGEEGPAEKIWKITLSDRLESVATQSSVVAACDGYKRKCSDIKGPLCRNPKFRCVPCLENAQPIDERTMKEV